MLLYTYPAIRGHRPVKHEMHATLKSTGHGYFILVGFVLLDLYVKKSTKAIRQKKYQGDMLQKVPWRYVNT
jgi:hypothetical protein